MIQNILITSAGRRVSLLHNFQKTLKHYNPKGKVYTTDMAPCLSAACQISDGYLKVPRVTDPMYLEVLKTFCLENSISLVVPTIDTELSVLAGAKEMFESEGIFIAVSSKEVCDTFYLKDSTAHFFIDHGFETPKIVEINEKTDYPVFAKINNSSCSIGAKQVSSLQESLRLLEENDTYIFQEFIVGEEYTVDVFIDRCSQVVSVVPRLRLEVRAGEVSKARTVKDPDIISEVIRLCEAMNGAYGCLTIQLFKTRDRLVFIEVNPRFGGGYPLSYLSGADFAKFLIEDYMGNTLEYDDSWVDGRTMLRYDAEVIVDDCSV
jgi:carbamoyl-phosphate synthase large subunit